MENRILYVEGLSKKFGGIVAVDCVNFHVNKGEILGVLGPNGAGKTTLINLISGFTTPDSGCVFLFNKKIHCLPSFKISQMGLGRTFQKIRVVGGLSVLENVLLAFPKQTGENLFNVVFNFYKVRKEEAIFSSKAKELLCLAGLSGVFDSLASQLSYGQQKLLNLICCAACDFSVMFLDEPFSGVSPGMIQEISKLIKHLCEKGKTFVIVEHNVDALLKICNRVLFLESGKIIYDGDPQGIKDEKSVIESYLG